MSESFGARLRRERERRQITLADIAARTKIKASLFEQLERDDISQWPAGLFRRSFFRAYVDAVGLDVDSTLREFAERFPDCTDPPAERPQGQSETPDTGNAAPTLRLTLVSTTTPFTGGRLLQNVRNRWAAIAWDAGSLLSVAITIFMLVEKFWLPLGVTSLCYYLGGILFLGNSPGVCLFAPEYDISSRGGTPTERPARVRHPDPTRIRQGDAVVNPFRSVRHSHSSRPELTNLN